MRIWFVRKSTMMLHRDILPSISVPPSISLLNPDAGKLSVRKGSNVRLACNATGYPAPTILWQREVSSPCIAFKRRTYSREW